MTPREPDRFEAKARELYAERGGEQPTSVEVDFLAAALRAAEAEALERAAHNLRGAANGWRIYEHATAEQAFEVAIRALLTEARALASPAAAPAAETGKGPSEPAAPAMDANEIIYRCEHDAGHPVSACTVCLPLAVMATLEAAAGTMCWRCRIDPHHRDLENCSASPIRALATRAPPGAGEGKT